MISVTVQGPGCRATCCFKVALCNSWGAGFNPQCRAELCIIQRILHHVCLNAAHVPSCRSADFMQLLSSRCYGGGGGTEYFHLLPCLRAVLVNCLYSESVGVILMLCFVDFPVAWILSFLCPHCLFQVSLIIVVMHLR